MTLMKLHDWQEVDQEYLKKHNYRTLLNIEPGGMKTAASLMAHKNSGSNVTLVVAPQNAHLNAWNDDAIKFLGEEVRVISNGRKAERVAMEDFLLGFPGIYVVTPQLLTRSDVDMWRGDMLVIDEGHMLNGYGKQGCKKMLSLTPKFDGRLFLSGTAFRQNFERAWATGRFLWPELSAPGEVANENYYLWLRERMEKEQVLKEAVKWYPVSESQFRNAPEGFWTKRIQGRPHMGKPNLVDKWLVESEPGRWINEAPSVITHKKREHCCDFHPNGFLDLEEPQIITHVIDLDRTQKRAIKELEDQYLTWLDHNPLVVELPLHLQQRIRALCLGVPEIDTRIDLNKDMEEVEKQTLRFEEDAKSPFVEYLIGLLEENEEPVIVFLETQSFAPALVKKLHKAGISAFEFSGKTLRTRDQDLAQFGTKYRVMVAQITSAGTGTDGIQNVTGTEVWLERSVDETSNIQGESRADRYGAKRQVQRHIFVDSEGYAAGRWSKQMEKRLQMDKSLKRKV